jgi:hypothetical protein
MKPFSVCLAAAPLLASAVVLTGCPKKEEPKPTTATSASAAAPGVAAPVTKLDAIPRKDFNRVAAELALPVYWSADKNKNNAVDPDELVVYWGLEPGAAQGEYVGKHGFTPKMEDAYEAMVKRHRQGAVNPPGLDAKEIRRRDAVLKELSQGKGTLVQTDLTKASPEEKRFVGFILQAAGLVEALYRKQMGTYDLASKVPDGDTASKTLFFRAQGPKCGAPLTQGDPSCSAIPDPPKGKLSGMYPPEMLAKDKFCDALAKKKALIDPFTVIQGDLKAPKAVPYNEVYKEDLDKISGQLKAAAEALGDKEPALKSYLLADAQAFTDNKWWPADEAWAKMDGKNSKYYLRIAPDENYLEPCSTRALFQVSFGVINPTALKWQEKLDPLKKDMEKALADLAGPPYKVRDVQFKLPDAVDIALNAGNARGEFGATIGESLPNYGPVSEGHGRTIVMTNFYTDPDSVAQAEETTKSLFCKDTIGLYTKDTEPLLVSTILHEASHNLGPSNQYKVNGRVDREVFGGPLAATFEELKAQTAAMYFIDWLADRSATDKDMAAKAHVRDVVWMFGHISRGMYDEDKHPRNYSQLAAIQLGWFMKDGGVTFRPDELAANGKDKGCFSIDPAKLTPSVKKLMSEVAQIKSKGDKARAERLVKEFVDVTGDKKKVHDVIAERLLKTPKQTFVYAIKLD